MVTLKTKDNVFCWKKKWFSTVKSFNTPHTIWFAKYFHSYKWVKSSLFVNSNAISLKFDFGWRLELIFKLFTKEKLFDSRGGGAGGEEEKASTRRFSLMYVRASVMTSRPFDAVVVGLTEIRSPCAESPLVLELLKRILFRNFSRFFGANEFCNQMIV